MNPFDELTTSIQRYKILSEERDKLTKQVEAKTDEMVNLDQRMTELQAQIRVMQ